MILTNFTFRGRFLNPVKRLVKSKAKIRSKNPTAIAKTGPIEIETTGVVLEAITTMTISQEVLEIDPTLDATADEPANIVG